MPDDFSLPGREAFLSQAYFSVDRALNFSSKEPWDLDFARWTLIERVIWHFMIDACRYKNFYCHLDGFSTDWCQEFESAFIRVGRIYHLPAPGIPGPIPTILAVEFNSEKASLRKAVILFGDKISNAYAVQRQEFKSFDDFFFNCERLGDNWEVGFIRDATGWKKPPDFDISFLLVEE